MLSGTGIFSDAMGKAGGKIRCSSSAKAGKPASFLRFGWCNVEFFKSAVTE
jgi:hypothetical protein